ncbi:MAG TPA: hypothetical protein VFD70_11130, partial [Anaerolineae bacterium]|nr:hypothetical protein [Anaerolineae bacterium]
VVPQDTRIKLPFGLVAPDKHPISDADGIVLLHFHPIAGAPQGEWGTPEGTLAIQRAHELARSKLDAVAFAREWAKGQELTVEELLEKASA